MIGTTVEADNAATVLRKSPTLDVRRASLDETLALVATNDYIALANDDAGTLVDWAEAFRDRRVVVIPNVDRWPTLTRALATRRCGLVWLELKPTRKPVVAAKRVRDIVIAAMGLIVLAPVFGVLAVMVKLSSPGPVFFATNVIGRDGKPFLWRKLRSLTVVAGADDAARRERLHMFIRGDLTGAHGAVAYKVVDTSRVTLVGRVMRRHSVDELPQLWNVVRGEMTLVGPRPCLPHEYEVQRPWQRLRYRVTPGLTGPWQAYGRSRVPFDEMALMDYCYTRMRSSWLDLRVLARTASVVVTGEGGK